MSLFDQFSWDGTRAFPFWWSAYWLGPTAIPPITMPIGLTDRVTGLVYYMQVTNDGTHLTFTTATPATPHRIYAAFDGPFVGNFGLRMGISSGNLVVDVFPEFGPGPFCSGVSNNLIAAVVFAVNQSHAGNIIADHLAFQSAAVQGSIFDPTP